MFVVPASIPTTGGYVIEGSANFADAGANHLSWTPAGTGDSRTVMTVEAVFKLFSLATDQHIFAASDSAGNNIERLYIDATGNLHYEIFVGGVTVVHYETTALFRDFSAWYQVVVIRNGNTVTLYVNGTAVTAFDTSDAPTGDNGMFGHTEAHYIGRKPWTTSGYLDLAIARLTYQDGVAASISDYGKAVGNGWSISDASSLSLGTNGVQITGGTDMAAGTLTRAGTAHSVSKTGTITATNDSPTNSTDGSGTYGNYANFNDEYQIGSTAYNNATYSQGRTHATYANGEGSVLSQAVALGNGIYFEATLTTPFGSTFYDTVGFIDPTRYASTITNIQESPATGYSFFKSNGQKSDDGATLASYGSAWDTAGKVIGVYISPTGKVWYTIDGTLQNSATESEVVNDTGTSHAFTLSGFGQILPVLSARGSNTVWDLNCGQFAWNTTPYSGYAGPSTANLPAPTVTDPSAYFSTVLYTGDGNDDRDIGGLNFQPDLVWIKDRDNAKSHQINDAVRGTGKNLSSDSSGEEVSDADRLQAFNSDGFQVGTHTNVNANTADYVAWCLKANGAGSSNTDGSVTSTASVADHNGFAIIKHTNTSGDYTVGHGMGQAPDMLIQKGLGTQGWLVWTAALGVDGYLALHSTDPVANPAGDPWSDTSPTSSVFTIAGTTWYGGSSFDIVTYAFARTPGLIGIGSYTATGNADGPYVVVDDGGVGFRPAFVLFKDYTGAANWQIMDAVRDPYNPIGSELYPNTSGAESTAGSPFVDFTANGFKCRATGDPNNSGRSYIYLAFAEYPFGGDGVEQARAR